MSDFAGLKYLKMLNYPQAKERGPLGGTFSFVGVPFIADSIWMCVMQSVISWSLHFIYSEK